MEANDNKNIIEEIGDTFWYLAVIENCVQLPEIIAEDALEFPEKTSLFWLGEMQDVVKRAIFYGEDLYILNKKGVVPIRRLALAFHGINYCLQEVNRQYIHGSQEMYFTANIIKLSKRYPELLFKPEDALDRNVENELSHIPEQVPSIETTEQAVGMLHARAQLSTEVPNCSALFAAEALAMLDGNEFNHQLREHLTTAQIEQLAMTLAFNTAATYRAMGANGIAQAYDGLYSNYSGRGDKLDDFSCFMMWQFLDYDLNWEAIVDKLVELKVYG